MKKFLLDTLAAVVASIALAYVLYVATGRNWIGYDDTTRIAWGAALGGIVSAAVLVVRLFAPRVSPMVVAPCAIFAFWYAVSLLLPGNNAGVTLFYAGVAVGMGLWIGGGVSLLRRVMDTND